MSMAAMAFFLLSFTGPADPDRAGEAPVSIAMVAVQALNEERENDSKVYDPGIDAATQKALSSLPYNTFRKISDGRARTRMKKEARLPIDSAYTLCVTPLSREPNGLIRTNAYIEQRTAKDPDNPRKILNTTIRAVPNDRVILGGPSLDPGALVVALTISP